MASLTAPAATGPRDPALVGIDEVLARPGHHDAVIDVRSESEFADDHLPGAISCPVLDDAERAEVGTLYVQVSPFEARRRGAVLVARNIARHLEQRFAGEPRTWRPLVYCWRGGERSAAFAMVLQRVGWRALRLQGGYRAYRRAVIEALVQLPVGFDLRVLCGPTGSGKSRLLSALQRAGAQVLDLEQLGAHRGSVLGDLPGEPQPSQRQFESRLLAALRAVDPARPLFVESESRRLGRLQLPDTLLATMRAAACVRVELAVAERVRLLAVDYDHFRQSPEAILAPLARLTELHGRERVAAWQKLARDGAGEELVADLLQRHYDPAYRRSIEAHFPRLKDAPTVAPASAAQADFDAAARQLMQDRDAR